MFVPSDITQFRVFHRKNTGTTGYAVYKAIRIGVTTGLFNRNYVCVCVFVLRTFA